MNHSVKGTIDGVEGTAPPATPNIPAHERLMLLEQSLDHLPIGVTVYDAEFRLLTWNSTAEEILDTPPGLLRNDMPVTDLIAHLFAMGFYGEGESDQLVA